MSLENYKQILTQLGETVGLPELAADADNYCCLGFDDKIIVHIQYNMERESMMLFCQLGIVNEFTKKALYPKMLKANLFWQGTGGATIGVDDQSMEALICYHLDMKYDADFQKFQEILEQFINTAELWMDTLVAIQRGEDAPMPKPKAATGTEGRPLPESFGGGSASREEDVPPPMGMRA